MKIPFVDLYAQYLSIKKEIDDAIEMVIKDSAYIGGSLVSNFEKEFATYLNINHVVACANGTDSIEIILQGLGIGPGDEVIVPALSWISTSEAVSAIGAKPIFVDIQSDYYTIDTEKIESKITTSTKAIIPVHIYGFPADMIRIMEIAQKHNLHIIEDCAQAHGAEINGKKVGTFGVASSFSFYPGKNLGAYGDAGCMATNDKELESKIRMIANHGQLKKHDHVIEGRNSRLDGLHAAILSVKLKHLNQWTNARITNANQYNELLLETQHVVLPKEKDNYKHVYHLYVIRSNNRDRLIQEFEKNDIGCAIHYPEALPFLKAYASRGYTPNDFPVAYKAVREIVSIPMFAELTSQMLSKVADTIKSFNE